MRQPIIRQLTIVTAGLAVATALSATPASAQDVKREITQIEGDLYRFQNNSHFSVFLVTEEGVIATDPIDTEAATWLQAEIDSRFNQPIRYVVYSHDHADHISGGEVWADAGAVVIAHEQARADIIDNQRPTAIPDVTFNNRMTIELGGQQVELAFLGKSHSDNMIVMHFPEQRTLFTVDFISVERLPYQTMGDGFFPDWIEAIKKVEAMDFDTLAPGHGNLGTKQDATDHRQYLETLYSAVQEARVAGKSVEEMKAEILLEDYKDWGQYEDWRPMNIEGMAGYVN